MRGLRSKPVLSAKPTFETAINPTTPRTPDFQSGTARRPGRPTCSREKRIKILSCGAIYQSQDRSLAERTLIVANQVLRGLRAL